MKNAGVDQATPASSFCHDVRWLFAASQQDIQHEVEI